MTKNDRPRRAADSETVIHPIPPTWDRGSRVLILGSFPSVRSRETGYFYGHPRNRFWQVLAAVCGEEPPGTTDEKKSFLLRQGIAVWDVVSSCEIVGSSDARIRNAVPNDLLPILDAAPITKIFTNGKTAFCLYERFILPVTGIKAVCLPSTSPANAAWSTPKLIDAWRVVKKE